MSKNNDYTKEEKEQIVQEYLKGEGSLQMLAEKYNLNKPIYYINKIIIPYTKKF